jgi:hypothetical protein
MDDFMVKVYGRDEQSLDKQSFDGADQASSYSSELKGNKDVQRIELLQRVGAAWHEVTHYRRDELGEWELVNIRDNFPATQ